MNPAAERDPFPAFGEEVADLVAVARDLVSDAPNDLVQLKKSLLDRSEPGRLGRLDFRLGLGGLRRGALFGGLGKESQRLVVGFGVGRGYKQADSFITMALT